MVVTSTKSAKVLIVEDEVIIAETLKQMLSEMGCNVTAIAHNLGEFRTELKSGNLDIVFLDVNLSGKHEGLALAEECQSANIPFVFVTSYSDKETIRKAIAMKPLTYINKPFTELDLFKVCEMMKTQKSDETGVLKIKDGHDTVHIRYKDIRWLKAENVYTHIQTENKKYLHRASLKEMLNNLPEEQFFKTHRSYVVNVNKVQRVSSDTVMVDGDSIPLSRTQKAILNEKMA